MANDAIIDVRNLTFSYGRRQVLHGIDLAVPSKSIYGFLGPNGAGKTTTIQILLGLNRGISERLALFGLEQRNHRIEILSRVGALVDKPSLYEHLTGRQNLEITRKLIDAPPDRIDRSLEIVKLTDSAHRKVNEYSFGMKQRLGIAMALLSNAELLVFDEPANGLDPQGIIEVRELFQRLNREHAKTIFLSSHILSEVERLATEVGVIHRGRMVFQGSLERLHERWSESYEVEVENRQAALAILVDKGFDATAEGVDIIRLNGVSRDAVPATIHTLVAAGVKVFRFEPVRRELERIFLDLTRDDSGESQ